MAETETWVTVTLEEGMRFRGEDERGLSILMEGEGGAHPTPMRVLAMALGGCTGMDVISILRKMRQDVTGYAIRVGGPRAGDHPHVFTALSVEHLVRGRNLDPEKVARAVTLSATRYCPVSAMLRHAAPVTHTWQAIDDATGESRARGTVEEGVAQQSS
jgi:putative redox protein